jgi:hypothetical protein
MIQSPIPLQHVGSTWHRNYYYYFFFASRLPAPPATRRRTFLSSFLRIRHPSRSSAAGTPRRGGFSSTRRSSRLPPAARPLLLPAPTAAHPLCHRRDRSSVQPTTGGYGSSPLRRCPRGALGGPGGRARRWRGRMIHPPSLSSG